MVVVVGIGGGHVLRQEEVGADAVRAIRAIAATAIGAEVAVGGDTGGDDDTLATWELG